MNDSNKYMAICLLIGLTINIALFFLLKWLIPVLFDFITSLNILLKIATLILAAVLVKYGRILSKEVAYFWDAYIFNRYKRSSTNLQIGNAVFILSALIIIVTLFVIYARMDFIMITELLYISWFIWALNAFFIPKEK